MGNELQNGLSAGITCALYYGTADVDYEKGETMNELTRNLLYGG